MNFDRDRENCKHLKHLRVNDKYTVLHVYHSSANDITFFSTKILSRTVGLKKKQQQILREVTVNSSISK